MISWGRGLTGAALAACLLASSVSAGTQNVLRVGVARIAEPSPNAVIFGATFGAIEAALEDHRLEVRELPHAELEAAVCSGSLDLFIASSGIYRRIVRCGARDLATAIMPPYNDPNFSDGSAIVVLNERKDLQKLEDLRGRRLAVNATVTFSGYHVPLGEIAKLGVDPLAFFSTTTEVGIGASSPLVLNELKGGRADAAFLKQCLLEEHIRQNPAEKDFFRVLNRKDTEGECQRSTDLYPSWTIGSTRSTSPEVSRRVTSAILGMPARSGTLRWGVATDYTRVDDLFRTLRIGPYSYLREWTMKRFIDAFWPWLMLFAAGVAGLVLHSLTVGKLVQKRTRELHATLNAYAESQKETAEATRRLETMQKIGVVNQLSSILAHETRQPLGAIAL